MGRNIYEKILARASGKEEFAAGDVLWLTPDLISCHDMLVPQAWGFLEKVGVRTLPKPEKIVAVIDHCPDQFISPAGAEINKTFREWVERNGIVDFYDTGRGGFQVQVLAEKGYARPGMVLATDDTEGEACGGLGAFVKGMEELGTPMAIDKFWFVVPEFVKYFVTGKFRRGVLAIDLRYKLHGDFGEAFGKYIEFAGPAIDEMSIDERMNLCSSLYLSNSKGIIAADQKTVDYVKSRTNKPFEAVRSDADAQYAEVYDCDVSELVPQVAFPPSNCNTRPVSEADGIEIDEACIGSCTSGRMDDLRIAAEILKGRKVHPKVRLLINAASQEVYLSALKEGLIEVFVEAGAFMYPSSCGACGGFIGHLAAGEVAITTHTVNYPGRMGSNEATIYLASPATVAASAVAGRISDPREYLS